MTTTNKTKSAFRAGPAAKAAAHARQQEELAARRVDTRARLAAKAAAEPDGIWADLLAEHDARTKAANG